MLSQFDYKNDANEFVFYGIVQATDFNFKRYNQYASICLNHILDDYEIRIYSNEYFYGKFKGFSTIIAYKYSEIKKILNNPSLVTVFECRMKLALLNLYIISNPIFVCLCDWPNDTDFFKSNFARSTYGLISEFEPYIIDCDKHGGRNSKDWIKIIKSVGELILSKHDGII